MNSLSRSILFLALLPATVRAQESLPQAPTPNLAQPFRAHIWDDFYTASLTCYVGASHAGQTTRAVGACGGAVGFTLLWFEVGAFTPQAAQTGPTGYWTVDTVLPLDPWHDVHHTDSRHPRRILPLATLGYTRIFQTANAVDVSAGADVAIDHGHSLRFELKDYLSFNGGMQQNAVVRISLVGWLVDP